MGKSLGKILATGATDDATTTKVAYHIRCLGLIHNVQAVGLAAIILRGVFGPR